MTSPHAPQGTLTLPSDTELVMQRSFSDVCLKSGMESGVHECYLNIDKLLLALLEPARKSA